MTIVRRQVLRIVTATALHWIFREIVSELAYDRTMYDEGSNDQGFKRSEWTIVWQFSDTELVARLLGIQITQLRLGLQRSNTKHRMTSR